MSGKPRHLGAVGSRDRPHKNNERGLEEWMTITEAHLTSSQQGRKSKKDMNGTQETRPNQGGKESWAMQHEQEGKEMMEGTQKEKSGNDHETGYIPGLTLLLLFFPFCALASASATASLRFPVARFTLRTKCLTFFTKSSTGKCIYDAKAQDARRRGLDGNRTTMICDGAIAGDNEQGTEIRQTSHSSFVYQVNSPSTHLSNRHPDCSCLVPSPLRSALKPLNIPLDIIRDRSSPFRGHKPTRAEDTAKFCANTADEGGRTEDGSTVIVFAFRNLCNKDIDFGRRNRSKESTASTRSSPPTT
jgi:hypothetical protein